MASSKMTPLPAQGRSRQRLRRPLVLVVDDVDDNRDMYIDYLEGAGFGAFGAPDGASAVEAARARLPAVIVMDLSLPIMDGCEATRIIKSDPQTKDIVVIAVTGRAEPIFREQARLAGCDVFITKPCSPQELAEHIRRVLDQASDDASSQ